jgi:hypothetical protein
MGGLRLWYGGDVEIGVVESLFTRLRRDYFGEAEILV